MNWTRASLALLLAAALCLSVACALAEGGDFIYTDVDGDGAVSAGDIVVIGVYPQTLVRDEALLDALAPLGGALPTEEDPGDWISFGYLNNQQPSDFLFYRDVEWQGERYRGVVTLAYRSAAGNKENNADNSYVDDEGFELGQAYWFVWEPIEWVVLGETEDGVLAQARYCLEAQPFQDLFEQAAKERFIPGTDIPVSDWEHCSLRAFLNGEFKALAFTEQQQARLQTVTLDNRTTGNEPDYERQTRQSDTQDQIFLLSIADMRNTAYGYPTEDDYDKRISQDREDPNGIPDAMLRRKSFTDYPLILGLRRSNMAWNKDGEPVCWWALRSAGDRQYNISGITKYGSIQYSGSAVNAAYDVAAVCPAIVLDLSK